VCKKLQVRRFEVAVQTENFKCLSQPVNDDRLNVDVPFVAPQISLTFQKAMPALCCIVKLKIYLIFQIKIFVPTLYWKDLNLGVLKESNLFGKTLEPVG